MPLAIPLLPSALFLPVDPVHLADPPNLPDLPDLCVQALNAMIATIAGINSFGKI